MTRARTVLLAAAMTAVVGACSRAGDGATGGRVERDPLSGTWDVVFQVEEGPVEEPQDVNRFEVRGRLVLTRMARGKGGRAEPLMHFDSTTTHEGLYDAALQPMKAHILTVNGRALSWKVVVAREVRGGEIEIVLNPSVDHGAVVMRGTLRSDGIRGSFHVTDLAVGARGTFSMRRVSYAECCGTR